MSFLDAIFRRNKEKQKESDPLVAAIADVQEACEMLGEAWKAALELDSGPKLHNKINLARLTAECLKANGLHRVLTEAEDFGAGIADITTVARRARGL
jgi:hypothetical protein